MFREGLLLDADTELEHQFQRRLPFLVMPDERVVLQCVLRALDIYIFQRMRRIFQLEVLDIPRGHSKVMGLRHAEVAINVRRLTGTDLECAVDIAIAVRIAVGEGKNGNFLIVHEAADESAAGTRRHTAHGNENAVRFFVVAVVNKTLEKRGCFDHEDHLRLALKPEVFHARGDAPRAGTELGAVNLDVLARRGVHVNDYQRAADIAAALFRDVSELLAVDREHGFHVVEQRIAFGLLVEPAFAPALAVVIDFALARDVVLVQQVVLRGGQQAHGLRERFDGVVGQRAGGGLVEDFEVSALEVVLHIGQRPDREAHGRLPVLLHNVRMHFARNINNLLRGGFFGHHV